MMAFDLRSDYRVPVGIYASREDVHAGASGAWKTCSDNTALMRLRMDGYVTRSIRVSGAQLQEDRQTSDAREAEWSAHRRRVDQLADAFIEGRPLGPEVHDDWALKEQVLSRVADRLRATLADDFLVKALLGREPALSPQRNIE